MTVRSLACIRSIHLGESMTEQYDGGGESQISPQAELDIDSLLKRAFDGEINLLTLTRRERLEIIAKVAQYFKKSAEKHDRAGTFPFENYRLLRAIHFPALTIPKALGGGEQRGGGGDDTGARARAPGAAHPCQRRRGPTRRPGRPGRPD